MYDEKFLDATLHADLKVDTGDGTYYIYNNTEKELPQELPRLISELSSCLFDAVKLERYLEKNYGISASIKLVNKAGEIFLIDDDKINDMTNIFTRLKNKLNKSFKDYEAKKNNNNYVIIALLYFLFLTGNISFNQEKEYTQFINKDGSSALEDNRFQRFNKDINYFIANTY